MNKLEVGMYVRTKNKGIKKILSIGEYLNFWGEKYEYRGTI